MANAGGYRALIRWADTHGQVEAFGVEGTGSYGAGLTWAVRRAGHRVVEVNRGDRRTRRTAGKSDTIDAEVAARSVLSGQSTATPKTADGVVEMMRQLKIARDTAVKARTAGLCQVNIARTGFASDEIATRTLDLDTRRLTPDPEGTFA